MKFLYVRLINYIGIYNGLKLNEIYIDFRKSKNNIVVIKGKNGSGKSTIFNTLHPLPESNDNFIPKMKAIKEIGIGLNDHVYDIIFIHDVNQKNNEQRETTKAYIKKNNVELNVNGNITSYKDIIYSEFNLDSNFVELSQLSSGNRGLADKKPTERKHFMGNIIDKVSVFNNMLKTISKRSSIFKSMVNNITTKIDNIGDKTILETTLLSIEERINNSLNQKDMLLEQLAMDKSNIKLKDPDGSIQLLYNNIYNDINNINPSLEDISIKINNIYNKLNLNPDIDITKYYKELNVNNMEYQIELQIKENNINLSLSNKEQHIGRLEGRNAKLMSLSMDQNYKDLENAIKDNSTKLNKYDSIINEMGLDKNNLLSKDEYILGLNTLLEIKEIINIFKSNMESYIIKKSIDNILNNEKSKLEDIQRSITEITSNIVNGTSELKELYSIRNTLEILNLRPGECKIDSCSFISNAVELYNRYPKLEEKISELEDKNNTLEKLLNSLNETLGKEKEISDCMNYLNRIVRTINLHKSILQKLPYSNLFTNYNLILKKIYNHETFSEIDELYKYIDYCNILDEYNIVKNLLHSLQNDYKIYLSKNEMIEEITNDISNINKELDDITYIIERDNLETLQLKNNISNIKLNILEVELLLELLKNKKDLEDKKNILLQKFFTIKNTMQEIRIHANNIIELNSQIDSITKIINPLIQDRDELKHNLKLLGEYKIELGEFKQKYDKIETIKEYLTPSKKGIQSLFIEMYMNKTIHLANQLLDYMYHGELILLPFEVGENGFKIPAIGKGLRNDDVSSMSTSEVCMISMILSFVLLQQSSTKYNIIKLDEIDGGLDSENRNKFIYLLDNIREVMNCEQCIIITHNPEVDLEYCDIIQLIKIDNEPIVGNIIYEY